MSTVAASVILEQVSCKKCGGVFALNEKFLKHARNNRGHYNCPYCDTQWSWSESEADRLRAQLAASANELQRVKMDCNAERSMRESAERRAVEAQRKIKRVENGLCPCCNRTFRNLRRHMLVRHPNETNPPKTSSRRSHRDSPAKTS